ncbi:MAG: hypothetical protein ABI165_00940 [Bryobacteraceae bacterium]
MGRSPWTAADGLVRLPADRLGVRLPATVTVQNGSPDTGVAPGLLVQITGRNLGPATQVNAQLDASGRLPFVLSNTIVFFGNLPAPLTSVEALSIICFAPFEIASTTEIIVSSNGQRSSAVRARVMPSAPQILSIANQDGIPNSADHPAQPGSVISLYVSGLGETNPPGDDGLVNTAPLPVPLLPVSVFLPGGQVTPQAVEAAPGQIAGITQVNVQLPASLAAPAGATPHAVQIGVNSASATLYLPQ